MREAKQHEATRDEDHAARLSQLRTQEQLMARMKAEFQMMQHELQKREGSYKYVKQMVEEGEIQVDDKGEIQPLQSKMKH